MKDLDLPVVEPIRIPTCPMCHTAHRTEGRASLHGRNIAARIRKIGKDAHRLIRESRVTNYFY